MATYYYSLILKIDKVPTYEKRVGVDAANDADATSWITTNDSNYNVSTTYIYLRKVYSSEALDRGFATHDGVGASTDTAITAGSVGSLNAKIRLITSQLDTIKTDLAALKTAELPFATTTDGTVTASSSTITEIKVGASPLTGRRGFWITNMGTASVFTSGRNNVAVSGANRGREIEVGAIQFEPYSGTRYMVSASSLNVHVEEVS